MSLMTAYIAMSPPVSNAESMNAFIHFVMKSSKKLVLTWPSRHNGCLKAKARRPLYRGLCPGKGNIEPQKEASRE